MSTTVKPIDAIYKYLDAETKSYASPGISATINKRQDILNKGLNSGVSYPSKNFVGK